jgi:hypothetical protein
MCQRKQKGKTAKKKEKDRERQRIKRQTRRRRQRPPSCGINTTGTQQSAISSTSEPQTSGKSDITHAENPLLWNASSSDDKYFWTSDWYWSPGGGWLRNSVLLDDGTFQVAFCWSAEGGYLNKNIPPPDFDPTGYLRDYPAAWESPKSRHPRPDVYYPSKFSSSNFMPPAGRSPGVVRLQFPSPSLPQLKPPLSTSPTIYDSVYWPQNTARKTPITLSKAAPETSRKTENRSSQAPRNIGIFTSEIRDSEREIERIVNSRRTKGRFKYEVLWKKDNSNRAEKSWEPLCNIISAPDASESIQEFERRFHTKPKPTEKEIRRAKVERENS